MRANDDSNGLPIRQGGYATLYLLAGLRLSDRLKGSVNVRNGMDVKYLNSLEWGQVAHGAPRSLVGTVRATF